MPAGFLAYILPVGGGGPVDPGYSPPWARPNPPGQGGGQPPYPDQGLPPFPSQGLPGSQPRPDNTLPGGQGGYPSHPIYYPPYPDQGLPPFPSQGLPGQQPRPDQGLPPFPSHPIYFPPAGGEPPLGIWGPTDPRPGYGLPGSQPKPDQGLPPFPSHPIVLPPDLPPVTPEGGPIDWKVAWTPQTGWIVVGIPNEPHPVPSK
jgi:hypothetical protein